MVAAKAGSDFDLTPTSLKPLEPYRDYLTIISHTDCRMAEAFTDNEVGGDHNRSSAAYLTQAKPKQTISSDIYSGISMDQVYAQRFGQDTPIPSIQLAIESADTAGCHYGYACVYMGPISWATPTKPLPMVRDPRVVFDQLFGSGGTPEDRSARRRTDRSILDWITREVSRLKNDLGPTDRVRLDQYLEDVREVERRIQKVEEHNAAAGPGELPRMPIGVPDSFEEHLQIAEQEGRPYVQLRDRFGSSSPLREPARRDSVASRRIPRHFSIRDRINGRGITAGRGRISWDGPQSAV